MNDNSDKPDKSLCKLLDYLRCLMMLYGNHDFKAYALSHVPLQLINDNTDLKIQGLSLVLKNGCHPFVIELIYLKELVIWFKNIFFHWMDAPQCLSCQEPMSCVDEVRSERNELFCTKVEVYKCSDCGTSDFLNRFVDPRVLFITRKGRCSEFSLCFTLICLSLGMRARYVHDTSDHCWTEVYSPYRHYWIHVDPSEGIVNQPLLYESEWGKKLSYIFAVGETDIQDVTWRYSSNHNLIKERRALGKKYEYINELCHNRHILLKKMQAEYVMRELLLVIEELAGLLIENKPNISQRSSKVS